MELLISFLEGIVTFISPCLLPMIPIYVTYFAAGKELRTATVLRNAIGFVVGFTVVFVLMGALAGTIGSFLVRYRTVFDVICGAIVVLFGLSFLGIIRINAFKGIRANVNTQQLGFFSSLLFGVVFSVGWTPCVGAFLGSALVLASQQGSAVTGVLMLLCYSVGLGVPFVLCALLIDKLKGAFDAIKRHYAVITKVCGWLLVLVGVLMATGLLGNLLAMLS